ncbi:MAG: hypothetical protein IKI59_03095 [Clostridia bacterium]|nr:hypothetical protein [Clostridia bacterium]
MAELMEYKCPCCGAGLTFSSALQKMKCEYCDSEFDVETLKAYDEALKKTEAQKPDVDAPTGSEWQFGEQDGIRVYVCESCGGEVLGDATLAASACPFCGNPVIMKQQFAGDLRPDLVIPFKLDKKAAKAAFEKHLKGKRLLPKVFKSENHIDEIKGVYVPFWLFDTDVEAMVRYHGTRVRHWSDARYSYTETSHYSILCGGTLGFTGIPVDGSEKMDDTLMESLEPFDLKDAVDFQTAYLAGYFADRYDVTAEASIPRAQERVRVSTESAIASTVSGYATVTNESSNIQTLKNTSRYALFPVWLLNTTWNGKQYRFAMNGQTGKFVGDLPMDKGAFAKWWTLVGLGAAAGAYLLLSACSAAML